MLIGTNNRWVALELYRNAGFFSVRWPSRKYTQVELRLDKHSITMSNNIGGQLGPERLSHGIYWNDWTQCGIRIH